MNSLLPILLLAVVAATSCSSQGLSDLEDQSSQIGKRVNANRMAPRPYPLNKRSADPQEPSTVIESDEPIDRVLMRFSNGEEEAELVNDNYEAQGQRQKRRARRRGYLIRVCNRRTRRCRYILVIKRN